MPYCKKCGAPCIDGALYCYACGEKISAAPGAGDAAEPSAASAQTLDSASAAAPAPVVITMPVAAPEPKKSNAWKWVVAAVVAIVIIAFVVFAVMNMDPDWKSTAAAALEDEGYTDVVIVSCDVEKGKNMLGWDLAEVEGEFRYGGSQTLHEYDMLCRKMDNDWYVIWIEVDS